MLKPFICGTGSFDHPMEEHDQGKPRSNTPTSKKSRKIGSCKTKENKNPYSSRGLDKFSALLAELEDKRQRIYSQINPDEISFLRFTYSNSNDCRPILVRVKQTNQDSNSHRPVPFPVVDDLKEGTLAPSSPAVMARKEVLAKEEVKARLFSTDKETMEKMMKKKKKQSSITTMKKLGMQRTLNYLTAALILTLVLLVLFGKSFAILGLSMGWYLVPAINKGAERFELGNSKKKDCTRRQSENLKMDDGSSSPNSVLAGPTAGYATPRRQGPPKCW